MIRTGREQHVVTDKRHQTTYDGNITLMEDIVTQKMSTYRTDYALTMHEHFSFGHLYNVIPEEIYMRYS